MKPYLRVISAAVFLVLALILISGLLLGGRTFAAWAVAGVTIGVIAWLCPYPGPDADD